MIEYQLLEFLKLLESHLRETKGFQLSSPILAVHWKWTPLCLELVMSEKLLQSILQIRDDSLDQHQCLSLAHKYLLYQTKP